MYNCLSIPRLSKISEYLINHFSKRVLFILKENLYTLTACAFPYGCSKVVIVVTTSSFLNVTRPRLAQRM